MSRPVLLGESDFEMIDAALCEQREAVVHLLSEIDAVRQGLSIDTSNACEWLAQICTALNQIDHHVHYPSGAKS